MAQENTSTPAVLLPERGVKLLPNGKLAVVLSISIDDLAYVHRNFYTVLWELSQHKIPKPTREALAMLIPIFDDLLLNENQLSRALQEPTED